ncbi:hypothetical protein MRX96_035335 [Rhipicephalus microplus]
MILEVLHEAALTLRLSSCYSFYDRFNYLGYDISAERVRPGSLKIECVADFPKPADVKQLRSFLGLTSYFRKFVEVYVTIARSLTKLTVKHEDWAWTTHPDAAFIELKQRLVERPVLAHFLLKRNLKSMQAAARMDSQQYCCKNRQPGSFIWLFTLAYERRNTRNGTTHTNLKRYRLCGLWKSFGRI